MGEKALLIIDAQVGLLSPPAHEGEAVVSRIASLLERARDASAPVIFVQHSSSPGGSVDPATDRWPIHPRIAPRAGEPVISKRLCDSFYETTLQAELAGRNIDHLVIAGCRTEYCIDTACRRATSLGYKVTLVRDAHTTFGDGALEASQTIAHHNHVLDGFGTDKAQVILQRHDEISFALAR